MTKAAIEFVEVRPLKPFCGSYRCALADADVVDDHIIENANGEVVKSKVARKRYVGFVGYIRSASPEEAHAIKVNAAKAPGVEPIPLAPGIEAVTATTVRDNRLAGNVRLPKDVSIDVIARGLAEKI